ncbi:hypothetical protein BJ508DRAFT_374004 [Ascobolus immersus RN42]|uniref:Uncharacterized protein n=1 Tax=Ascobolus immersus RN42 TaxID=1160509 RepID=A0A3N4IFU1_ASCIM|nr:hypothetical protein BJ508DRAFT_374004 [Ascobolus immersus RN42]
MATPYRSDLDTLLKLFLSLLPDGPRGRFQDAIFPNPNLAYDENHNPIEDDTHPIAAEPTPKNFNTPTSQHKCRRRLGLPVPDSRHYKTVELFIRFFTDTQLLDDEKKDILWSLGGAAGVAKKLVDLGYVCLNAYNERCCEEECPLAALAQGDSASVDMDPQAQEAEAWKRWDALVKSHYDRCKRIERLEEQGEADQEFLTRLREERDAVQAEAMEILKGLLDSEGEEKKEDVPVGDAAAEELEPLVKRPRYQDTPVTNVHQTACNQQKTPAT